MDNNTFQHADAKNRGGVEDRRRSSSGQFVVGLAAGAMLGVGIGLWLSPRTSGLRQWLDEAASEVGGRAAEQFREAGTKVAAAAEGLASAAKSVPDGVAETVVQGASEASRIASAVNR